MVDAHEPPDRWPAEAIETILDRGSLSDWRVVKDAIAANPWGPAARTVESIASWGEHYGVDAMMLRSIRISREAVDRAARERYATKVRAWRQQTGLSMRRFARLVGTSSGRLSDYENAKVAPTTDVLGRIEEVSARQAAGRGASR